MKKIMLSAVFFFLSLLPSFTQAAVIDVASIAAAIENGLTMYKDLQATMAQFQSSIEQLNAIKKSMEGISADDISWKKWDSALKAVDSYMTQMEHIENVYKSKNMKIGNVSFSLEDLFDSNVYEKIGEEFVPPEQMTESDRKAFFARHGLSPEHYMKLKFISEQLGEKAKEAVAQSSLAKKKNEEALNACRSLQKTGGGDTSSLAVANKSLMAQNQSLEHTIMIENKLSELADSIMLNDRYAIEKAEADEEAEKNRSGHADVSDYIRSSTGREEDYFGPGKTFTGIKMRD